MLLEDAKKMRTAKQEKEDKQDKTVVTGIMTTKDGIKEVDISLGSNGLEITEKESILLENKKIRKNGIIKKRKSERPFKHGR